MVAPDLILWNHSDKETRSSHAFWLPEWEIEENADQICESEFRVHTGTVALNAQRNGIDRSILGPRFAMLTIELPVLPHTGSWHPQTSCFEKKVSYFVGKHHRPLLYIVLLTAIRQVRELDGHINLSNGLGLDHTIDVKMIYFLEGIPKI